MDTTDLALQVKSLTDAGEFEGIAASYRTDRAGDRIMPGAFSKSLVRNGGEFPVLWAHQQAEPIGVGKLKDTPAGLEIRGKLALSIARAREAYDLLKLGAIKALSVGLLIVGEPKYEGRTRLISEADLFEVSLVACPMDPGARVVAVKAAVLAPLSVYRARLELARRR